MSESEFVVVFRSRGKSDEVRWPPSPSRQAAITQAFSLWRQHHEVMRIEFGGGEVIEGEELMALIRKQGDN